MVRSRVIYRYDITWPDHNIGGVKVPVPFEAGIHGGYTFCFENHTCTSVSSKGDSTNNGLIITRYTGSDTP